MDKSKEHSIVSHTRVKTMVNAHKIDRLQTRFEEPIPVKKVSTHWGPDLTGNSSMHTFSQVILTHVDLLESPRLFSFNVVGAVPVCIPLVY